MLAAKLFVLSAMTIAVAIGNKPSLSDNRGLRDERLQFNFAIKDYVFGSLWPKPQEEAKGEQLLSLNSDKFQFTHSGEDSDVIQEALVRYKLLTFPDTAVTADSAFPEITSLNVHVDSKYAPMDYEMDESYALVIASPTSSIEAKTVWGALRGIETFSQAVYQNTSKMYYASENKISDSPRFHHRGFLIDTSRHFVAVSVIQKFIDALAYSKYNVLHWHIVDSDSFPFVSKTYPDLHEKGAFNKTTHVYTPEDVQKVIEYARFRGVRVLPEFDTPGHTASWFSIPNLLTPCYTGDKPNGNYGPVDPTVESNYEFLQNFFKEVAEVFPDKYLHLGGDEVPFGCWQSNPNIAKWMADHGMAKNYSLLEQYYEQRLLDIVGKLGKQYVIWQEVIDNQVKVQADTVVNIWKGHGDEWKAEAIDVTKKGYKIILSSPWYLNYISYGPDWPGVQADTVVNVWKGGWQNEMAKVTKIGYHAILSSPWYLNYISYGPDWPNYYKVDPQSFSGTQEQLDLVMGGTACMWGEWVDGTNLLSRTWARGLAIGERLWSSKDTTDVNDAAMRMWEHRCRYIRRGIPAENVVESQYCRHEWMAYTGKDEL